MVCEVRNLDLVALHDRDLKEEEWRSGKVQEARADAADVCPRAQRLRGVVDERSAERTFKFQPSIPLESLPAGAAREEAHRVCGEVTPTDVAVIERELATGFASFFAALPACVAEHLRPAVRAQWEQEHYFVIVKAVVRRETKADTLCHRDQRVLAAV